MVTTNRTESSSARPVSSPVRTVGLVAAGVVIAGGATSIVAIVSSTLGAANGFAPLMPAVYLPFAAVGVIASVIGWRIIRSRASHPVTLLRVLVPVVLATSFIPDVILMITQFIPGTTLIGGLSLAVMHVIVAAVAVPIALRVTPVAPVAA